MDSYFIKELIRQDFTGFLLVAFLKKATKSNRLRRIQINFF
jgi:hypothetical protein